jgi:hypothetical protein
MITDGFTDSDPEYLQAVALMSQANKPTKFLVGVVTPGTTEKVITYVGSLTTGTVSAKINGTVYSTAFDTDQDTTLSALATLIQGDDGISTAVYEDVGKTLTLTSTAGSDISVGVLTLSDLSSASVAATAGSSTYDTEIAAISEQNDSWYALLLSEYSYQDAIDSASYVSTVEKILALTVHDEQAKSASDESSLIYYFENNSFDRVITFFHNTTTARVAAAALGERLPTDPGSGTWKFKTLVGIPADTLSSTDISSLSANNANYYTEVGGVNIVQEGTVSNGEFIDVIRGADWTKSRIQENIYSDLVNFDKIPYTDKGLSVFDKQLRSVFQEGIDNGLFVRNGNESIFIPKVADIPSADVAARKVTGITFNFPLAGAVHAAVIAGSVTV